LEERNLIEAIKALHDGQIRLMEVCGTHTVSISRSGIRGILPKGLELLSGPGCPVCVTPQEEIKQAMDLAREKDTLLLTFGDLMRVPTKHGSFETLKAEGADIRVIFSPFDAIRIAEENPGKKVVFFSVGFETTAPAVAATIVEAKKRGLKNLFFLSAHKLIPPALRALLEGRRVLIDGFILPGHVSVIIGKEPYEFIPQQFGIPCVITGFETHDILEGILMLLKQIREKRAEVQIQYKRAVRPEGNPRARTLMEEVFAERDSRWRGLGLIPLSGFGLRENFKEMDARVAFDLEEPEPIPDPPNCKCAEVLQGLLRPPECPLFGKGCTPQRPVGPCMVSSEGSCAAYYRYGDFHVG
jgi:hydrogenase expression/formation protein HypD